MSDATDAVADLLERSRTADAQHKADLREEAKIAALLVVATEMELLTNHLARVNDIAMRVITRLNDNLDSLLDDD